MIKNNKSCLEIQTTKLEQKRKKNGHEDYRKASCAMLASDSGHCPSKLLLLSLQILDHICLQVLEASQVTHRGGNFPAEEVIREIKSLELGKFSYL